MELSKTCTKPIYKYCSKQSNNRNWKWAFVLTPSLQMQSTKFTMWEISNKVDEGWYTPLLQKQIIIYQMCACLDLDAKKLCYSVVDFKDKLKNMIRNWSWSHSKEFFLVFSVWSANVGPSVVVWMFTITIKNTERLHKGFTLNSSMSWKKRMRKKVPSSLVNHF